MSHFPDRLKVKVGSEEAVLSITSTEYRVDEYTFPLEIFDQMVQAVESNSGNWEGATDLQVKIQESVRRASLAIRVSPAKREVHRMDLSHFRLMVSQYHSQAKGK